MSKQGTIIVVDDNKGVLSAVKLLLKNHFEHIVTLPSPITLPAALREENAQVVLLDMNFSSGLNTGNEGLYWLHEIKKIHPSLPVVLFTAYADIDLAVRGIKEGATDFIVKPWDNTRLIETLLSACRNSSKNKKRAEVPKTVSSMYWGAVSYTHLAENKTLPGRFSPICKPDVKQSPEYPKKSPSNVKQM